MEKSYIYTIAHPFTGEIRYVGVTRSLKNRAFSHLSSSNRCPGVAGFIKNLKEQYILPKIEVLEVVDRSISFEMEAYWISQCKAWGFDLLNFARNKSVIQKKRGMTRRFHLARWKLGETREMPIADVQIFKEAVAARIKNPRCWYCFAYSDSDRHGYVKAKRVEYLT